MMPTRADQEVPRVRTVQIRPSKSCTFHRQGLSKIQRWEACVQKNSNPHFSVGASSKTLMRVGEFHVHLLAFAREANETLGGGTDRLR